MTTEEINLTEIVETWRDRIKEAGKSEEQAAHESGLFKAQLSQYINGRSSPGIKKFEQFENYLRRLGV